MERATQERRIAAVVPTYNRATLVERALRSMLAQTRRPDEIIVVDDGSTDGTLDRLAAFGADVRVVSTDRRGASGARNAGVVAASHGWVAFLDSDDEWTPDHLERIDAAILATRGRAALYFDDTMRSGDRAGSTQWDLAGFAPASPFELREDGSPWVMASMHPMTTPAVVVRRDSFTGVGGFHEQLAVREDTLLFFELGLGQPLCAVAGVGVLTSADDVSGNRLTDEGQGRRYADATVELYENVLGRCDRASPTDRQVLRRRLGEAYWRRSRLSWAQGSRGRAITDAAQAARRSPRSFVARWRRWSGARHGTDT